MTQVFTKWPAKTLVVTGRDRGKFLHNLCSADVLSMNTGEAREAFLTNVKGHVLAHALLIARDESIDMVLFRKDVEAVVSHLDRYLIREEVEFQPSDQHPVLVVGGESRPANGNWVGMPLAALPAWIATEVNDPQQYLEQAAGSDEVAFTALRVQSGWPLEGVDFAAGTLPQELSRDGVAISFNKGCYLGQETIARLDALGHVNKQITLLEGAGATVGVTLHDGEKAVGTVTSSAPFGTTQLGLAMVRRGSNAVGTTLQSEAGEAVVQPLPVK